MSVSPAATSDADLQATARMLKAAAHPVRLKVLCLVGTGEVGVGEIIEAVGIPQNALSKHLAVLRNKRLLTSRKAGARMLYRLADKRILRLLTGICEVLCGTGRVGHRHRKSRIA